MSKAMLTSLFALALGASAAACSPPVPAAPTYTKDVQPILAAHCARCHNADLNGGIDPITGVADNPLWCRLDQYADSGDCTPDGVAARLCRYGAGSTFCTGQIPALITAPADSLARMPKPPSDPLNDWEKDVLLSWMKVMPPVE